MSSSSSKTLVSSIKLLHKSVDLTLCNKDNDDDDDDDKTEKFGLA
jgi:hypothetical protein